MIMPVRDEKKNHLLAALPDAEWQRQPGGGTKRWSLLSAAGAARQE